MFHVAALHPDKKQTNKNTKTHFSHSNGAFPKWLLQCVNIRMPGYCFSVCRVTRACRKRQLKPSLRGLSASVVRKTNSFRFHASIGKKNTVELLSDNVVIMKKRGLISHCDISGMLVWKIKTKDCIFSQI